MNKNNRTLSIFPWTKLTSTAAILQGQKQNKTNFAVPNSDVTEHWEVYFNVSPSFHGVKEANAVCWATDLDQILPAHPQQIGACNKSRKSILLPSCSKIFSKSLNSFPMTESLSCVPALSYDIIFPWIKMCCDFFTPVTWEAGEEPWERWEPVTVQPLLSVLQRGWWQKVLHVKKKKSPWNEYSSTASTVSK